MENKDIVENRGDDNDKQVQVVEAEDEKLEFQSDPESEPECADSLFGEDDVLCEDLVATPTTPGVAPLNFSHLLQSRRPHSSMGLAATLGLDELSLPPKSPLCGGRRQRQRTISTSGAINTEREPIIRASKRTIYTAGRPPWYDSQGQQVEPFVIGVWRVSQWEDYSG
jgi:hypothetical protein